MSQSNTIKQTIMKIKCTILSMLLAVILNTSCSEDVAYEEIEVQTNTTVQVQESVVGKDQDTDEPRKP